MKKIFITAMLLSIFTIPALAVCSLTGGACSNFDINASDDVKYNSNTTNQLLKQNYNKPYESNKINPARPISPSTGTYNSNCQFGICLPQNRQRDTFR